MFHLIVPETDAQARLVYVLYSCSKRLLIAMGVAFGAEIVVLSCVLARTTPELGFDDKCFVVYSPPIFIAYW